MLADFEYLLIQVRNPDDPMAPHEVNCFASHLHCAPDRIRTWDLLEGSPTRDDLRHCDIVLFGGSGDYYVSQQNQPQFAYYVELLNNLIARSHPMLGVCYGYQSLAKALGGTVVHRPDQAEIGTGSVTLTPEGCSDPLLGQLPDTFHVQQGHQDHVLSHPGTGPNLAESQLCPNQAFRIQDKPIWGVQFHPELTQHENRKRFIQYQHGYTLPEQNKILSSLTSSTHASSLISKFLKLIFGI